MLALNRFPPCGEIVVNYPNIGKTLNSIDLVNLMSSISVRFNSFLFLYSIFNEHKAQCSSFRKASCSRHCRVVGLDGLEPSTSRLSGARSNHLSYRPLTCWWSLVLIHLSDTVAGGDEGNRTLDPLLAGQVLSQLSYTPTVSRFGVLFTVFTCQGPCFQGPQN